MKDEKGRVNQVKSMRKTLIFLVLAAAMPAVPAFAQARLNMIELKQDAHVFEKILDERLKLNFTNPFAITASPMATYMQGYGVVVTFHLRIDRGRIRLPFGEIDAPDKLNREAVKKQIQKVRLILSECLSTHAGSIKQLGAHDRISISAHIEDRNELDPLQRRHVLVITTTKDDADLLAMRRITDEEFLSRLHVVDY